ncbi:hypothetical protein CC1G_02767 [Coprinopsis cinerea okayama7|uniref:Uncharacterized protein n=1 Tax=Coprinopsis cinerea (strain Okayama-7 / 130 / ATCC MYA-4618 / FGSC 9003) TaxID=240176 RepID=A8MZW8_COPC7|nr:hypothetical protein CC1G_02767 [Coprinopsis cinerea okayama7\|eukprot:XP_001828186.2 hypothetical protein CC1G_02767 [Coprinopsis cinerea okayama7\
MATLYEACIVEGEFIQRARDHSQALREAVVSIIQAKSPNQPGCEAGWENCFGWIMQGLGRLKEQGYLSQENYDKFLAYWNTHKECVKASTDGNSITLCGLDPNTTPGSDLTLRGLKNASACVKQKKKLAVAKKGTQPTGKGGPGKAPTKGPAQRRPKAHTQAKKAQPARSSKAPNGKKAK